MKDHNETKCESTNHILILASDRDLGFIIALTLREETSYEVRLEVEEEEVVEPSRQMTRELVLLDEQLTGKEVLVRYECFQDASDRQIPVLLLGTSRPQNGSNRQQLCWIKIPFDWDKLLQTVTTLLDAS